MNRCNLIPLKRRQAMARARRVRTWGCVAVVEAALICCAAAAIWTRGEAQPSSSGELTRAVQENAQLVGTANAAQLTLATALDRRETSRQFIDQPDWSLLLIAINRSLSADGMLSRCEIAPISEVRPPNTADVPSMAAAAQMPPRLVGFSVRLSGLAQSQNAVSQVVIRLEDLRLFEKVDLVQTNPQLLPADAGSGFAFQVGCTISAARDEVRP